QLAAGIPPLGVEVVVSSTFTAETLLEPLRFWCDRIGLTGRIVSTGYNQVWQSLLAERSAPLEANAFHVILLRLEDWGRRNEAGADETVLSIGEVARNVEEFVAH